MNSKATATARTLTNVYGSYTMVKQSYGSNPWFAVLAGQEEHCTQARWIPTNDTIVQTLDGPVQTDGLKRFFASKRALVNALNGVGLGE